MKRHLLTFILLFTAGRALFAGNVSESPATQGALAEETYTNPVIAHNCPDPTVIDDRARTGWFYAYCTQSSLAECTDNPQARGRVVLPVYRSKDMVHWEFVGDGFDGHQPDWRPGSRLWAPDINYVDGHYVLYYALGVWGDLIASASGVAVSDSPTGPFRDCGLLVDFNTIGVKNSIDPNLFVYKGKKYLIWGSLGEGSGVWGIRLSRDGLSLKKNAKPVQLGADNMEGAYMVRRGRYCYLFTSRGSCCEGARSTYHVLVARSRKPLGPFVGRDGVSLLDKQCQSVILTGSNDQMYVGTGHNSQLIKDDAGNDWLFYHTYWNGNDYRGRCMNMDAIVWSEDGWPAIMGGQPSTSHAAPVIRS